MYYGNRTVQSGLYIYDAGRDALIPAESLDWRLGSVDSEYSDVQDDVYEVYISSYVSDTRYERSIELGSESAALNLHIEDVDVAFAEYASSAPADDPGLVDVENVAEYDAAENSRRGGVGQIETALAAVDIDSELVVSRVAYYVYAPPPALWRVLNVMALLVIPVAFAVCFVLVARAFYRAKLERPIEAMGEAARRIAAGDLDFSMAPPPEGSHDELDGLCAAFETMREELERANRESWRQAEVRRRGNAAFAHDMRTPLTVLKGRAEMLSAASFSGEIDAQRVASIASALSSQVQRLELYVESMRQLAAAEDCPVAKKPVGMQPWFAGCAQSVEDAASAVRLSECGDGGLSVHVEASGLPTVALMDDAVVGRVVENMVGNAARFAASQVSVKVSWHEGMLEVCVQDDGPGFDESALAHACDAYWRHGASDRGHLGLGLSICSGLCARHGGSFEIANAPGGGALVTACFAAPVPDASDSSDGVGLQ